MNVGGFLYPRSDRKATIKETVCGLYVDTRVCREESEIASRREEEKEKMMTKQRPKNTQNRERERER